MHTADIQVQLKERLKKLRLEHDMTQEKLAQKAGISLYYIQLLEGKKPKNPTLLIMQKLATAFDMPLWKLLRFEE